MLLAETSPVASTNYESNLIPMTVFLFIMWPWLLLGDNKVAYWVPKDGLPDDQFSWLSTSQLTEALKRLNARSILVVSDSCFSGAMTRDPPNLSAFSNDRRLTLL